MRSTRKNARGKTVDDTGEKGPASRSAVDSSHPKGVMGLLVRAAHACTVGRGRKKREDQQHVHLLQKRVAFYSGASGSTVQLQ